MLKDKNSGPAVNYKLNNGGIIGIITPISKHFCSECGKGFRSLKDYFLLH